MDTSVNIGTLALKSPIVVASCSLSIMPKSCLSFEKAGAGAIVMKSIFQEEILAEYAATNSSIRAEQYEYLAQYHEEECLDKYCDIIRDIKALCTIPVIASVSCVNAEGWPAYARKFQDAGADALELNVMSLESAADYQYGDMETRHVEILQAVKSVVDIPIFVKVGSCLTNAVRLVAALYEAGAAAVVLFNKMCPVDINVEEVCYKMGQVMTGTTEIYNTMRWTALSSAGVPDMPIMASGGVCDGEALVKVLLSGAVAGQVCSPLYTQGASAIREMYDYLVAWMERHDYASPAAFTGLLDASGREGAARFERIQFVKNISKAKSLKI